MRLDPFSPFSDGHDIQGVVLRLNKKMVSVDTGDGHRWNVAPSLLRLIKAAGDGLVF